MFKKARYLFRNVFGFSRTESNAAIVLILLMILMFIIPPLVKSINVTSYEQLDSDKAVLDSMVAAFEKKKLIEENEKPFTATPEFFPFNPNTVNLDTMILFGIPENLAKRIVNYRNSGGKFFIKSDLLKVYGFPSEKYKELHPFMELPEEKPVNKKPPKNKISNPPPSPDKNKVLVNFDLNLADTTQLKELKGIGSVLSARIIKYRNSLGGFISNDQLTEVYGLDELALQQLKNYADIQVNFVPNKLNINTVDAEKLAAHPYISKKLAQRIIAFREHHGPYNEQIRLDELKEIDSEMKLKIYPYLDFK